MFTLKIFNLDGSIIIEQIAFLTSGMGFTIDVCLSFMLPHAGCCPGTNQQCISEATGS